MASEVSTPYHLRRPTGILSLDLALGGGFHAGGGAEIHGPESVGKTHLGYKTIAQNQKLYGEEAAALVFGTEIRTDKGFARWAEVCVGYSDHEIEEFSIIRKAQGKDPFTDEEIADLKMNIGSIVFLAAETADVGFDIICDSLEKDVFKIVLIESLGALLTPAMDEKDVGSKHVGGSAGIITNFQNKIYRHFLLDRDDQGTMLETTIIGINQARAEMDRSSPRAPKTHAAAGAYAWKHGQMASVNLSRGKSIILKNNGPTVGRVVNWKMTKGKVGTHDGLNGSYDYYHVPRGEPVFWKDVQKTFAGVDTTSDTIQCAMGLGVIEVSGAWLYWIDAHGNEIKAQGKDNFSEAFMENLEDNLTLIKDQCLTESNLTVRWK